MSNSEIEQIVETGQVKVAKTGTVLRCLALGSCVAVVLYDSEQAVGGVAHVMLPSKTTYIDGDELLKYADKAIHSLIAELLKLGAKRENLKAKLIGGALMIKDTTNVGAENIQAIKDKLAQEGIEIVSQRLGGNKSRSIAFDPATGIVNYTEEGVKEQL